MVRRSDARARLIDAARTVVYRQGWSPTTLGDVAKAASIPLGNVYYHFRSKDDLAEAVIAARQAEIDAMLAACDGEAEPVDRLVKYLERTAASRDQIARYGCPYATLSSELEKAGGTLGERAASLLRSQLQWIRKQFRAIGMGRRSDALGLELTAAAQGASLLTHALGDPTIMRRRTRALQRWVRDLAEG